MRKLLLLLLVVILLSGCQPKNVVDNSGLDEQDVYTKEEVDEMLSDLALGVLMEDIKYLQLALDEVYTKDELDEGFEDVVLYLQALEDRIESLEQGLNEYDEGTATLSMLNVMIYMYENRDVELTEEDILMYETLLTFRDELRTQLEKENNNE